MTTEKMTLEQAINQVGDEPIKIAYPEFNTRFPEWSINYLEDRENGKVLFRFGKDEIEGIELEENYPWDYEHVVIVYDDDYDVIWER